MELSLPSDDRLNECANTETIETSCVAVMGAAYTVYLRPRTLTQLHKAFIAGHGS